MMTTGVLIVYRSAIYKATESHSSIGSSRSEDESRGRLYGRTPVRPYVRLSVLQDITSAASGGLLLLSDSVRGINVIPI